MRPLSRSITYNVIAQLHQGLSCRKVANNLGLSPSTVIGIKHERAEHIPESKKGHPYKVSKVTRRNLARQYNIGELEKLKEGQKLVKATEGVHVSKRSIRNYLNMEDMKTFVKQKKPDLTEDHKRSRYEFAKKHLNWTLEDWKNVMFSDEVAISRVEPSGKQYYFKKRTDKTIRPHHIKRTKQGGGGKIMIWGCITYYGLGDACRLPDEVNSETYIDGLKDYIFSSRDYYEMDPSKFLFQHDNARIHTSNLTKAYIKKSKIPILIWPPNSPDLNLIETIWAYIKRKLEEYSTEPNDIDELWERFQDIWTDIPLSFIHNLYASMPQRMKELFHNKGGTIQY